MKKRAKTREACLANGKLGTQKKSFRIRGQRWARLANALRECVDDMPKVAFVRNNLAQVILTVRDGNRNGGAARLIANCDLGVGFSLFPRHVDLTLS